MNEGYQDQGTEQQPTILLGLKSSYERRQEATRLREQATKVLAELAKKRLELEDKDGDPAVLEIKKAQYRDAAYENENKARQYENKAHQHEEAARIQDVLDDWYRTVAGYYGRAFRRARFFQLGSVIFGLPIVILSTIVGTSAFATLQEVDPFWQLIAAILGLTIAVLSSVQTFFRFSERAQQHQVTAAEYSELRWDLRYFISAPVERNRAEIDSLLDNVKEKMKRIEQRSLGIDQRRVEERQAQSQPSKR